MFEKIIIIQFTDVDGCDYIREHYEMIMDLLGGDEIIVVDFSSTVDYFNKVGHIKDSLVYIQSNYVKQVRHLVGILEKNNNQFHKVDLELLAFFNSKYQCYDFLKRNGFKQQETSYLKANRLSYPFVIKADEGYKGEKVWLVDNKKDFDRINIENQEDELLVQEYNQDSYGKDIRIIIFPKFNLYFRRVGASGNWKSNIGYGPNRGSRERMTFLPDVIETGIVDLKKAIYSEFPNLKLRAEYFAIDVYDDGDFNVIEMNYNPGFSEDLFAMFSDSKQAIKDYVRESLMLSSRIED